MSITYKPRNDFVVFEILRVDKVRGVVMPDAVQEGEEYKVVAVGPKVEGLSPGDKVYILGRFRENWMLIPGTNNYGLTRETNVSVIVEEDDGK